MDPDANLEEQRAIRARMLDGEDEPDDLERLADLTEALDEWLSKGGFLPKAWESMRGKYVGHVPKPVKR